MLGSTQPNRVYQGSNLIWEAILAPIAGKHIRFTTTGSTVKFSLFDTAGGTLTATVVGGTGTFTTTNPGGSTSLAWEGTQDNLTVPVEVVITAGPNDLLPSFQGTLFGTSITQIALDCSKFGSLRQSVEDQTVLTSLTAINSSGVTSTIGTFQGCTALTSVSGLDLTNVGEAYVMFNNCSSLTEIPDLDYSHLANLASGFRNCTGLTTVGDIDLSAATNLSELFNGCTSLTSVGVLATSAATATNLMFYLDAALTCVKGVDTLATVTGSAVNMFNGCTALTSPSSANQTIIEAGAVWNAPTCDDINV